MNSGVLGGLGLLMAAGVWEGVAMSGFVPNAYFPTLQAIASALVSMIATGGLIQADALTVGRAVLGWACAVVLGLGLALAAADSRTATRMTGPAADLLRGIPPAALVPLAIYYLGTGTSLYLAIVVFAAIWPIYINANHGLQHVDRMLLDTGTALRLKRWETLFVLRLPAALPEIFTGLRLAAGFSLMGAVVSEMLAGQNGIGYVIYQSAFTMQTPQTYAALLIIGLDGIAMNYALASLRRRTLRWHVRLTAARALGTT